MLLVKVALAGLIWDCKTSIRLLSLLLLGDVHTSKRLGVAAADLLTTLTGKLPHVLREKVHAGLVRVLDHPVVARVHVDGDVGQLACREAGEAGQGEADRREVGGSRLHPTETCARLIATCWCG